MIVANLSSKAQNLVGKVAGKAHSSLYRATDGRVGGRFLGGPVLLLNTRGRKSGQRRTTPLLYVMDGEDFVLIASNGGAQKHPAWYLNLKANPDATVEIEGRETHARAEEVTDPEEKARLWQKMIEMYSGYDGYQRKTNRQIPLLVLHPLD
jgi:deazaflavin-dependent oxidoreductase (nitroreductase family)